MAGLGTSHTGPRSRPDNPHQYCRLGGCTKYCMERQMFYSRRTCLATSDGIPSRQCVQEVSGQSTLPLQPLPTVIYISDRILVYTTRSFFHVIFIFCSINIVQNMKTTWEKLPAVCVQRVQLVQLCSPMFHGTQRVESAKCYFG